MKAKLMFLVMTAMLVLVVAPNAMAAGPQATKLEKVSSLVQPGIVYLETTFQGRVRDPLNKSWIGEGKVFSVTLSCSGFFVNPDGHFVSAGHCVDYAEGRSILVQQAAQWSYENELWVPGTTIDDVVGLAEDRWKVHSAELTARQRPDREVVAAYGVDVGGLPTGKALPARVLGLRSFEKGDVSLLSVEADDVPVLQLAPEADINVGTEVVSVGYPASVDYVTDQTFDPSFKEGSVSSEKTLSGGLVKAYEISAAVSGGMSGGPTVDLRGRVIGVNSFGIQGEPQPFNFVTPASEVAEVLQDKGVDNTLGKTNSLYRAGLAAYYAGDREQALSSFDELLGLVRNHEFAQEFRSKALRLPEAEQSGGIPTLLIALSALGLVMVAMLAVLLQRRRRPGSPEGTAPVQPVMPVTPSRPAATPVARPIPMPVRPAQPAVLVMTAGPLEGERLPITAKVVLGRGVVDIGLDDPEVSRRHASLEPSGAGLVLTDLDSANGTSVNGRRIAGSVELGHGDVVSIGQTEMRVEVGAQAQATVLRAVQAVG